MGQIGGTPESMSGPEVRGYRKVLTLTGKRPGISSDIPSVYLRTVHSLLLVDGQMTIMGPARDTSESMSGPEVLGYRRGEI